MLNQPSGGSVSHLQYDKKEMPLICVYCYRILPNMVCLVLGMLIASGFLLAAISQEKVEEDEFESFPEYMTRKQGNKRVDEAAAGDLSTSENNQTEGENNKESENGQKRRIDANLMYNFDIDLSTSILPKNFTGHNPREIYDRICKEVATAVPKSDAMFLSNNEKADRTRECLRKILPDGNYLCFRVASIGETDYDPGNREFRKLIPQDVTLSSEREKTGEYVGQNAFGVTRKVETYQSRKMSISITDSPRSGRDPEYFSSLVRIPSYPTVAREQAGKLAVYLVCRLSFPGTESEYQFSKATLDSPWEVSAYSDILLVTLSEIWVVHSEDGKVLKKIKPWYLSMEQSANQMIWHMRRSGYANVSCRFFSGNICEIRFFKEETLSISRDYYVIQLRFFNGVWTPLAGMETRIYHNYLNLANETTRLSVPRWKNVWKNSDAFTYEYDYGTDVRRHFPLELMSIIEKHSASCSVSGYVK